MTPIPHGPIALDVPYPDHFHRETMPLWLHATVTALGYAAPDISTPYTWCELGCGGGLNVLLAAATNPSGRFVGIDVDTGQIERARGIARDAGITNVAFIARDLRDPGGDAADAEAHFDFIVTHGVWAWVADDVRQGMLEFVRRRLKPEGIAHVGYMTHPGASSLAALGKLMREFARHLPDNAADKARAALAFVRRLADAGSGYLAEHPGIARQLEALEHEDPAYLAHEFLVESWQPQHVADTIRAFATIDCAYLGSATPVENIDALSLPGDAQALLRELRSVPLAETFKDIARNQSLRRDLYQRAPAALSPERHLRALDTLRLAALPGAPTAGGLTFDTRIGRVPGPAELFDPVLRALAEGPHDFAQLRALAAFRDAPGLLNQVVQMLLWSGCAHPLRADDAQATAAGALDALLREPGRIVGPGGWRPLPRFGTALIGSQP
ncbi:class I SAM-dependent methyltransferase [Billgrantia endophytica]|uniref:SAM-dependent methyltransferase n=1 Tax=Billgrantia endophytica TaxID=2033802 RepID=A0A2N7TXC7_9GAMM|nr:class I SAM-dependent methyltransferase [Halomonas endophytica]PMR72830.1 SAM-dependent methyltransferase [Halomonas endophytica]